MSYKIGIVGAGHWSERLQMGIGEHTPFDICAAVDIASYREKEEVLTSLGVPENSFYQISPEEDIPAAFFDEVDVVQIASPVKYHKEQTLQSLAAGKLTITEKSYGSTREEFMEVVRFIDDNNLWGKTFLHLHYLRKMLTMNMPGVVSNGIRRHGSIQQIEATFFEEERDEDAGRTWLFHPDNGGIFLDWVHPVEVLVKGCAAEFTRLIEGEGYVTNAEYTAEHPTAAYAKFGVAGSLFTNDATATIRVGKGVLPEQRQKTIRIIFEDEAHIDFSYADTKTELSSDHRGEWEWREPIGNTYRVHQSGLPRGPIPYEFLLRDIITAIEHEETPLNRSEMLRIFEPVWLFNEQTGGDPPVKEADAVRAFIEEGHRRTTDEVTTQS